MFAAPLPAPVYGLGTQNFTGATAGTPNMQSRSPTRFGQPANNGGFGAFAAAQAGGSRTEVLPSPGLPVTLVCPRCSRFLRFCWQKMQSF